MRVVLQKGYILHQRPYRDSSLLLEAFTCNYGRVSLVSKGGRSSKSDKRALLQPFRSLVISWSGRGDLYTLTSIEPADNNISLKGDALYSGFYINELLMHLLHRHDPHEELYFLYNETISRLADEVSVEPILRSFEKRALQQLGYGLQLDSDYLTGEAISPDLQYAYEIEHGPTVVKNNYASSFPIISGGALIELQHERFENAMILKEIKQLMRAVITHYLGGVMLKSRELFK